MINGSARATRAKSARKTIVRERIRRNLLITTNTQAVLYQSYNSAASSSNSSCPSPTSSCAIVSAATLVRENIFLHAFRVEHEVVFLSKQEFGPSRWANFSWPILTDRDCLSRKL